MNTNTGVVYWGESEIRAAQDRGEPLAEVSENVANAAEVGMREIRKCCPGHLFAVNRAQRRAADKTCPFVRR